MSKYIVKQGDCISSIAYEHGLFWQTVWNDPRNADLRRNRNNPNVLLPGDEVEIPDKQPETVSAATDRRHRFVLKGVPAHLRLRLMERCEQEGSEQEEALDLSNELHTVYEEPKSRSTKEVSRANVPYTLKVGGRTISNESDGDGWINESIPPNAREATLVLNHGTPKESVITLRLGDLNPGDSVSGAKQRFSNLGFFCGDDSEACDEVFQNAVAEFQEQYGLTVTGNLDQPTIDRLLQVHDG